MWGVQQVCWFIRDRVRRFYGLRKDIEKLKFSRNALHIEGNASSLTALSKSFQTGEINFSRIAPNVVKTKTKLQQLLNEDKAMELLKEDIKKRLKPCNLVIYQKAEEKINSITERYVKAMIWNIDEQFPCNVFRHIQFGECSHRSALKRVQYLWLQ